MARILSSTRLWPLFVTVMPESCSTDELHEYIARVNALYGRKERFATLVDTSLIKTLPSAAERRLLAEWQQETVDLIRRYNVFTATVLRSAVVRGAFTAINWLFRPPNEQISVSSLGEGLEKCVQKLEAAGLPLPAELHDCARRASAVTLEELVGEGRVSRFPEPRRP